MFLSRLLLKENLRDVQENPTYVFLGKPECWSRIEQREHSHVKNFSIVFKSLRTVVKFRNILAAIPFG